jgi:ADP-dependent NAD(P)H-hydrate dehydratase / NAD(P)H-hydrate epimerase
VKVRAAEQALMARLPDGALMQRAAAGLAATCAHLLGRVYGKRVVVLAGSGDNGGDALYAAERLTRRGARTDAVLAGSRVHQGGAAALQLAGGRLVVVGGEAAVDEVAADLIDGADLIIDGMLGIGGRGGLREPQSWIAERAAAAGAIVVAVDLPSGIDADTGTVDGVAVRADVTVTFGTYKPGLLIDPGASHAGVVELVDIGLTDLAGPDVTALQAGDLAVMLPRPAAESDKYRRGVVGVLAGSDRFTGAAVLSVGGAVRGGAGMIRYLASSPRVAGLVRQRWPEAVITVADRPPADSAAAADLISVTGRVQAWVAGPGMGTDDDAARLLAAVLGTDVPVLVDADGLTLLASDRSLLHRDAPTLLTPHAGELARLLGTDRAAVEARRLEHATRAAAELGATVLLKGSTTVIAGVDEPARVNTMKTAWLATAGSGDVLSGLAGALLAQGLDPAAAAAAAAYLHGLAARLASDGAPIGASDLIVALPEAFRMVGEEREEMA